MHPPIKDHTNFMTGPIDVEDRQTDDSDNPVLDCSDSEDMARQEAKNETDLHYMLEKFGLVGPRGAPMYGEWDESIDLQVAIQAVTEAKAAFRDLPPELTNKFGSMEELLHAIETGALVIKDEEAPVDKPATTTTVPPATTTGA